MEGIWTPLGTGKTSLAGGGEGRSADAVVRGEEMGLQRQVEATCEGHYSMKKPTLGG